MGNTWIKVEEGCELPTDGRWVPIEPSQFGTEVASYQVPNSVSRKGYWIDAEGNETEVKWWFKLPPLPEGAN